MKRIGIDIDGVIADSQAVIIRKLNQHFGKSYTLADFVNFRPRKMFGINRKQLDDFIMARELEIIMETDPLPGAVETLRELNGRSIYLISARSPAYHSQTLEWLRKFDVPYDGIRLLGQHDKRRSCLDLGVDIFIEDNKKNAIQVSSCGIPVLLMNATYNRGRLPEMVTRVFNWDQIREHISKKC
ncbi:MAG: 5' nucleotidase, NT5C type [Bacillota bacterium]